MPQTTSKRMLLTLQPHTYEVVKRWAAAQKKPMATCITQMLEQQEPMLQVMTQAIESARAGKTAAAYEALQQMTGSALTQLGGVMKKKK